MMKPSAPVFRFKPFSRKQRQVLNWWCESSPVHDYDGIIADGAIRSGKTVAMSLSFVLWAMTAYNANNFAMCGKTIGSFRRNVLFWLKLMLKSRGYKVLDKRADNLIVVTRAKVQNYFYIFGGKDERSQDLIQGITLAGLFCDEVALMPQSFVNQAVARCSVDGAKLWFNCNPDNPHHWFKKEWIDKRNEKRILYLHFVMEDNLSLSERTRMRYRSRWTGVFFKRFILGLWVAAEGVIYNEFADNAEPFLLDSEPDDIIYATIGFDFGGNGSAHAGICTGFSRSLRRVIVLEEYYRKEVISPRTLEDDVCRFIRKCQQKYRVHDAYFDSAEQVLIKGIRTAVTNLKIPVNIKNAKKTPIIGRIRLTCQLMSQRRFFVMRHCEHLIGALQSAVWDTRQVTKDVRLDDGNYNIDSLDAFEYSIEPNLNDLIEIGGAKYEF